MSDDPKYLRFDPPHAPPVAPNPDYLPSSEEARAGLYSHYAVQVALYQGLMERYSIGFSERMKLASQRKAARSRRGR